MTDKSVSSGPAISKEACEHGSGCQAPASAMDRLYDAIKEVLMHHRLTHQLSAEDEDDHFPLVDALTPKGAGSIALGIEEIESICDAICNDDAVRAAVVAQKRDGHG